METSSHRAPSSPINSDPKAIGDGQTAAGGVFSRPWQWVPIRSLAPRHRERISQHLLQLAPRDLYLRFGYAASSVQVQRYVDTLDFERDEVFGIFNRHLTLIAMAHLAYPPSIRTPAAPAMAEFGVSVLAGARGRGYGSHLFDHAVLHARNRGMDALFIHALSQNGAMLKIAQRAGALIERDAGESDAWLKLPGSSMASHLEEALVAGASELNYRLKARTSQLQKIFHPPIPDTQAPDPRHQDPP